MNVNSTLCYVNSCLFRTRNSVYKLKNNNGTDLKINQLSGYWLFNHKHKLMLNTINSFRIQIILPICIQYCIPLIPVK
ncbi:hypothetical protein KSF78_0005983 [Schistosoma japonicum]|nr:hypothetical protein KSF78_0005983 [Schistosoma japonicum]